MSYFDKFDICEAYWQYAADYNVGGFATGRKRPQPLAANNGDIWSRLERLRFRISPLHKNADSLNENARAIYDQLAERAALFQ